MRASVPSMGALSLILATLAWGCGDEASSADLETAQAALFTARHLPGKSVTEPGLPAVCGPLPIFGEAGGRGAASRMFRLPSVRVQEAVGVFSSTDTATAVYKALITEKRTKCIQGSLGTFNGPDVSVSSSPPRDFGLSEESSTIRFLIRDPDGKVVGRVNAVSFRTGRCTATLVFLEESTPAPDSLVRETSEMAAGRMPATC